MNTLKIGLRRENKSHECRTVLTPEHVQELKRTHGIETYVQPSSLRVFSNDDYRKVGARIQDDLSECPVIFGLKEMPPDFFEPAKTYLFFSHTIKGQKHNRPMLQRLAELGCTLFDYERIMDESGRRLLFFGRYAGLAGMIDTLWSLGQRLQKEGVVSPFIDIKQTYHYSSLKEAVQAVRFCGERLQREGLPADVAPLVVGFTGYGNVSRGAQEIFDLLPFREISPADLLRLKGSGTNDSTYCYKVVFKEEDLVEPRLSTSTFGLQDYYNHPENYTSIFHRYLPFLSIIVNAIYWSPRYPRLVTMADLRKLFSGPSASLRIITDISCDIEGSMECTVKATQPDNPVYSWLPQKDTIIDGFSNSGLLVLPIDNFPCELPVESSRDFGNTLVKFVPEIASTDFHTSFSDLQLSSSLMSSLLMHRGIFTPKYDYMNEYISEHI